MLPNARGSLRQMANDPRQVAATLALFVIALAPRAWFVLEDHPPDHYLAVDMAQYLDRAHRLLTTPLGPQDAFLPVGYPAFIAGILGSTGGSLAAVAWANILLSAATVAVAFRIALRLLPVDLALVAALAVAFCPPLVFYAGFVLPETLFTFLVTAFLAALLEAAESPGYRWGLVAGALLGAATAVHPNAFLLLPLVAAIARIRSIPRPFLRSVAIGAGPLLLGFALFNSYASGRPALTSTNGGINFFMARSDHVAVRCRADPLLEGISPRPNASRGGSILTVPVHTYDESYFYRRGLEFLWHEPGVNLKNAAENVENGIGLGRLGYWPGSTQHARVLWDSRVGAFWLAVLPVAVSILGSLFWRRDRQSHALSLLRASLVVPLVTLVLFLGAPRTRVPFDPVILVLAVFAWLQFAMGCRVVLRRIFTQHVSTH
jgi:4-amino-4-deoxy-L-arabinose transferase-like glycosyltransferase